MATSSFLPGRGGIESHLAELAAELSPRVAVLAAPKRDGKPLPRNLGYPTIAGPGSMVVPRPAVLSCMVETARRFETDKVLFGTPWPLGLLAPGLKRRGMRYAFIVHGAELLVPAAVPGLRRVMAQALAGAELVLPVSAFTQTKVEDLLEKCGLPAPPMHLLRARVDTARFSPTAASERVVSELGLPRGKKVLSFGRLVKRKGVDRAIRAMEEVQQRVPGACLLIAGTGPELGRLRKLAQRTHIDVRFLGRVADDAAPALYAAADVFTLPVADRWFGLEVEGLGVVLLEASACATPCVAGRSGGTPEAVLHEETGLVVDARRDGELARAIAWMLTHPREANEMGANGRRHVASGFGGRSVPRALIDWLD